MRPRRLGARSIRGALGTYTWVAVAALLLLAAALALVWNSRAFREPAVQVTLGPAWTGAVLRPAGGGPPLELTTGDSVHVAPGRFELRLFGADGAVVERELDVVGEAVIVDG